MIDEYAQHLAAAGRAAGTIKLRTTHLTHLSRHYNLTTVTTGQLEQMLAARRDTHSAESRKSLRSSYRSFYRWADRTGNVTSNPAADLTPITVPVKVARVAADDVLQNALIVADQWQTAMIYLARFACLRLTELTTLHTSQRTNDELRIVGKGDKERVVYCNEDLMHALLTLERIQGRGYYFPGRISGHMHSASVNKIMTRLTGCNPHSLRHAGATAAYKATGDLRSVQLMLGHSSMATTQRYLHPGVNELRAVAAGTAFVSKDTRFRVSVAA
jgi:site-specific recombinase XerD